MKQQKEKVIDIKNLMEAFIRGSNLEKGLKKVHISEAWEKLMGSGISNYTSEVKLQNGTMIVVLSSSVLREELSHGKDKIITMINEEMGENVVKRLMLV